MPLAGNLDEHPFGYTQRRMLRSPGTGLLTRQDRVDTDALPDSAPLVVVIDDDPFTRKALTNVLRSLQCRVAEAESGVEGLRLIAQQTPQLVLLDLRMPTFGGADVLKELRASLLFATCRWWR